MKMRYSIVWLFFVGIFHPSMGYGASAVGDLRHPAGGSSSSVPVAGSVSHLDLSGQNFASVQDALRGRSNLDRVEVLNLTGARISNITADELRPLSRLRVLILDNNPITALTDNSFGDALPRLRMVMLNSCDIARVSTNAFQSCEQLAIIEMGDNEMTEFPNISGLTQLRHLDVSQNKITHIPDLSSNIQLAVLNCADNRIERVKAAVKAPDSLRIINVTNNRIRSFDVPFLKALARPVSIVHTGNPGSGTQAMKDSFKKGGFCSAGMTRSTPSKKKSDDPQVALVKESLVRDMRDKVIDHIVSLSKVSGGADGVGCDHFRHLLEQRLAVSDIYTKLADFGMWYYRNEWWISWTIVLAAGLSGGGIAVGIAAAAKKKVTQIVVKEVTKKVAASFIKSAGKQIATTALCSAAGGAVVSYLADYGVRLFTGGSDELFFQTSSWTAMTSKLRDDYKGIARAVALWTVIKQYLIVLSTYITWVSNYDEYRLDYDKVVLLRRAFEKDLHLEEQIRLCVENSIDFDHMMYGLVSRSELHELRSCVGDDLFSGQALDPEFFENESNVSYDSVSMKKTHIKELAVSLVSLYSDIIAPLRADLYNRFYGARTSVGLNALREHATAVTEKIDNIIGQIPSITSKMVDRFKKAKARNKGGSNQSLYRQFMAFHGELGHIEKIAERVKEQLADLAR